MDLYDNLEFPALPDRPYVFVNMVATVDGKAVAPDAEHDLFGGDHDRPVMLRLRAQADALIYGATTGKDVPPEEFLDKRFQADRKRYGRDPLMRFVMVAHNGKRLKPTDKIFSNPEFTPTVYLPEGKDLTVKNAELRRLGDSEVDLAALLAELKRDGVGTALVEGGPTTNGSFFAAGLVDEFFLTISPTIFGGKPILTAVEGDLLPPKLGKLELVSSESLGDEAFLRYRIGR